MHRRKVLRTEILEDKRLKLLVLRSERQTPFHQSACTLYTFRLPYPEKLNNEE